MAISGFVNKVTTTVKNVASKGVEKVSHTFGISDKAAKVVSIIAALAIGVGGVSFANSMWANNDNMAVLWADEEECVDYISQAQLALGNGTTVIPETMVDHGQTYTIGKGASWEATASWLSTHTGYDVKKMADFALSLRSSNKSRIDEYGFERIGDYYIVAVTDGPFRAAGEAQTHVGDILTISFNDGTAINALIGDFKEWDIQGDRYDQNNWSKVVNTTSIISSGELTCGWGHVYTNEVFVLEFWGSTDTTGNPMNGPLQRSCGSSATFGDWRVTSITNHGMAQEFVAYSGNSSSVTASMASIQAIYNSAAAGAMADCSVHGNYDNSNLATALVSYAASRLVDHKVTSLYKKVCDAVIGDGLYESCDHGVCAAVRWTGADSSFPPQPVQIAYLRQQSAVTGANKKWEKVGEWTRGQIQAGTTDIQPGDIGCRQDGGHIISYVGSEMVQLGYESFIKGTDGDVGEPYSGSVFVEASLGDFGACITNYNAGDVYIWFRYVGNYSDTTNASDVGSVGALSVASSAGTSCDCNGNAIGGVTNMPGSLTEEQRTKIVSFAKEQLAAHVAYNSGGTSSDEAGVKLSSNGLVYLAYAEAGVDIDKSVRDIMSNAPTVTSTGEVAKLNPGDIVCWDKFGDRRTDVGDRPLASYDHVAIYIGNGVIIESISGSGVQQRQISDDDFSYGVTW